MWHQEHQRLLFIARASDELNRSLDYPETLAALTRLAVPEIADWCAVDLTEGRKGNKLERVAVAHADAAHGERAHGSPGLQVAIASVLRSGQAEMSAELRELGLHSYICAPLRRGGETRGVLSLAMAGSCRGYGEPDLALATALADRAAIAVEYARLSRQVEQLHRHTEAELAGLHRLDEARAAAELANRAKDEFLAMLGHELRNPLAPILTALHLMELRAPDVFQRERTVIDRQVRHVVRLVDDLLDVSRITRGKIELHKEVVELSDVVARAIEMASPLLEERGHELAVHVARGLFVDGDPTRLAQVVSNLLNNAAKYTERGGRIDVAGERAGDRVVLSLRDTGIGIAQDMLPRIFDMFAQERQALDRAQGGLGLGLAIVRNIVALHGGEVAATSEGPGCGSEFVVSLPAFAPPAAPAGARPASERRPATRRLEHILVVDDNADALEMLADALELRGFTTSRAHDGPSALEVASKVQPQIALLDIGLPVMDGYELARRLRNADPALKLVAVTGYGHPSAVHRSQAAGFAAHLVKPVTVEAVQRTIDQLIAQR